MKRKRISWIAWGLFMIISVVDLTGIRRTIMNRGPVYNPLQLAGDLVQALSPVVFALIAALILSHQPGNIIGWLIMTPATLVVVASPLGNFLKAFPVAPPPTFSILVMTWFTNWGWLLLILPLLLIPLFFPTGHPPSPHWRWVFYLGITLAAIFILLASLQQELAAVEIADWMLSNPIGFLPSSVVEAIVIPWGLALGGFALLCVASLFIRFKHAGAVEREQIKWLLYACCLFAAVYVPGLFINIDLQSGLVGNIWNIVFNLAILTIPIAIAIAILRYRLWDIEVIIRRTLVYSALTSVLLALYFAGVVALQELFQLLTGEHQSSIATVLSTLAIAALFNPLRKRIQGGIDRRFYRRRYNAEHILQAFAATLRDEVDLDRMSSHLVSAIQETMQPESVSLWLKEQGERRFEAD